LKPADHFPAFLPLPCLLISKGPQGQKTAAAGEQKKNQHPGKKNGTESFRIA
jgi:hypothetical protein